MRLRLLEALGVVTAYTAVGVFATWPLARDPLGGFYGFGNDNWGGIPYLGWLHDADVGSASSTLIPEFQAPFGLVIPTMRCSRSSVSCPSLWRLRPGPRRLQRADLPQLRACRLHDVPARALRDRQSARCARGRVRLHVLAVPPRARDAVQRARRHPVDPALSARAPRPPAHRPPAARRVRRRRFRPRRDRLLLLRLVRRLVHGRGPARHRDRRRDQAEEDRMAPRAPADGDSRCGGGRCRDPATRSPARDFRELRALGRPRDARAPHLGGSALLRPAVDALRAAARQPDRRGSRARLGVPAAARRARVRAVAVHRICAPRACRARVPAYPLGQAGARTASLAASSRQALSPRA